MYSEQGNFKMSFYNHINNSEKYLCDRCKVAELNAEQYDNHKRPIENSDDVFRYCDECWNWIRIQTWTDKNGGVHSVRSERVIKEGVVI